MRWRAQSILAMGLLVETTYYYFLHTDTANTDLMIVNGVTGVTDCILKES